MSAMGGFGAGLRGRRAGSPAAVAVAALMFMVGLLMWTVVPLAILWATPRVLGRTAFLPAIELGLVVPAMLALGYVLSLLDSLHCRLTETDGRAYPPRPWARPFTNPAEGRKPPRMLDVVMAASVALAVAALLWSLLFGAP